MRQIAPKRGEIADAKEAAIVELTRVLETLWDLSRRLDQIEAEMQLICGERARDQFGEYL